MTKKSDHGTIRYGRAVDLSILRSGNFNPKSGIDPRNEEQIANWDRLAHGPLPRNAKATWPLQSEE